MPPPLFTQLADRFPIFAHDHVAVIYREREAAFRLTSFLVEGLQRGDVCQYFAPADFHAKMLEKILSLKVDPVPYLNSQSLRLREGVSDFYTLRNQTQQIFADAEDARVPAVRWLEEGCCADHAGFPFQQFFEFHAVLNLQVKHYPSVAVCQYSIDHLEPEHLFSAIATHRHLLIGDTLVRDNPFYIPAEKFIPLNPKERQRDLTQVFRDVGFDIDKLLYAIEGYGRLHPEISSR